MLAYGNRSALWRDMAEWRCVSIVCITIERYDQSVFARLESGTGGGGQVPGWFGADKVDAEDVGA
jgi:hypothetical protein